MNTQNIFIGLVVVIILAVGGYFIVMNPSSSEQPSANQSATTTAPTDQVQAQEVKEGTGTQAAPGAEVSVLYVGQLPDGTVFDSSEAHNNEPLKFTLGAPGMIPGFQIGVNGMKEGGERLIAIPPSLAYGTQDVKDQQGKVIIPANSTLIFKVQLVKVTPAPAGAATTTPAAR